MIVHTVRCCFILFIALFGLASCTPSEKSDRSVFFSTHDPASEEYRSELARQLRTTDGSSVTYTFERYAKIDGNDHIVVDIVTDDFQATATMRVESWDGLEGIRNTRGQGYAGAELKDLTFEVRNGGSGTEFIYAGVGAIVD
ncbi:MAG: hypothetical protein JSS89_01590 [Bacteroidetes bacterium]|nr:hypothetical protein [Bacteroidota bacterium]